MGTNAAFAKQRLEHCFLHLAFVGTRRHADVNLEIQVRELRIHAMSFACCKSVAIELSFKIATLGRREQKASLRVGCGEQRQPTSSPAEPRAGTLHPIKLLNGGRVVFFANCPERFCSKCLRRNMTRLFRGFRINGVDDSKRVGHGVDKVECHRVEVVQRTCRHIVTMSMAEAINNPQVGPARGNLSKLTSAKLHRRTASIGIIEVRKFLHRPGLINTPITGDTSPRSIIDGEMLVSWRRRVDTQKCAFPFPLARGDPNAGNARSIHHPHFWRCMIAVRSMRTETALSSAWHCEEQ